jgi:hypothetical protein
MTLTDKIQVAANLATVAAVIYAAAQLSQTATDTRIANSVKLLEQGFQLQQDYRDGKADIRSVYAYYHQLMLYSESDRLLAEPNRALGLALCTFVLADPRSEEFWKSADKRYYSASFVAMLDAIWRAKQCPTK